VHLTTPALLAKYYPGVPVRGNLGEHETLYSNAKAKRMLGWQPQHSWRKYVAAPPQAQAPADDLPLSGTDGPISKRARR
jgi:hypothetical protein